MTADTFAPGAYAELAEGSALERKVRDTYPMRSLDGHFYCGAMCVGRPAPRYLCTRPEGHDGPHVAHLDEEAACAWWPNEAQS